MSKTNIVAERTARIIADEQLDAGLFDDSEEDQQAKSKMLAETAKAVQAAIDREKEPLHRQIESLLSGVVRSDEDLQKQEQRAVEKACKPLVDALRELGAIPAYSYPGDVYPDTEGFLDGHRVGYAEGSADQAEKARAALVKVEKEKP